MTAPAAAASCRAYVSIPNCPSTLTARRRRRPPLAGSLIGPMLETRLRALSCPLTVDAHDETSVVALCSWLEDKFIRQYPIEERGPLRSGEFAAVREYAQELGSPQSVLTHFDNGRFLPLVTYLVAVAVQYEYSDKREQYECTEAASADGGEGLIAPTDTELLRIAAAFQVNTRADATATMLEVVKAVRKTPPREGVRSAGEAMLPSLPPELLACTTASRRSTACSSSSAHSISAAQKTAARSGQQARPFAPLSERTFPLGFAAEPRLVEPARVLRLLHVRQLRVLQDAVNAAIETLQEFTANPKTDAKLGRVGR